MLKMYRLLRVIRLPRIIEKVEMFIDRGILQVRARARGWQCRCCAVYKHGNQTFDLSQSGLCRPTQVARTYISWP